MRLVLQVEMISCSWQRPPDRSHKSLFYHHPNQYKLVLSKIVSFKEFVPLQRTWSELRDEVPVIISI